MRRSSAMTRALLMLLIAGAMIRAAEVPNDRAIADLDAAAIRATAEHLIALPDRAQGQPGAERAAAFLEERLRSIGLNPLRVRTTISVAVDRGSRLEMVGADDPAGSAAGPSSIVLTPLASNHAATAGTGGKAVSGPLLFAGRGRLEDLAGKAVAGAIVVLDPDARDGWTNAAMLGAVAVVVRSPETLDRFRIAPLALSASVAFPRFAGHVPAEADGRQATITSTVAWEPRPAWSVAAVIPGSGQVQDGVILTAGYEANGPLPHAGATRAWNAAVLLEFATRLAARPAKRPTLVVFNGGRGEFLRGLRELTAALVTDRAVGGFMPREGRLGELIDLVATQRWQAGLADQALAPFVAGRPIDVAELSGAFAGLVATAEAGGAVPPPSRLDDDKERLATLPGRILAITAGTWADRLRKPLENKRTRLAKGQIKTDGIPAMDPGESERLRREIAEDDAVYTGWRTVQLKLDAGKALSEAENRILDPVVASAGQTLGRHLAVLDARVADLASLAALRQATAGFAPIHLIALDLADGCDRFSSYANGWYQNWAPDLLWLHSSLVKQAETVRRSAADLAYDPSPHLLAGDSDAFWPEGHAHEAGIAGLYVFASTLATINDARERVGTPADTAENFRADRLLRQCRGLLPFVRAYIDNPDLSSKRAKLPPHRVSSAAINAQTLSVGSKTGRRGFPFPFTVVKFGETSTWNGDVRSMETHWGDFFGRDRVWFLPAQRPGGTNGTSDLKTAVYGLDPASGAINAAIASAGQQKPNADLKFSIASSSGAKLTDLLPVLFRCESTQAYQVFDPRLLAALTTFRPLSASSDAPPPYAHVESADGHVAIFTEADSGIRLKLGATQGKLGNRLVLLGEPMPTVAEQRQPRFSGLPISGNLSAQTPFDAAQDMWRLNDARLALLRRNGIDSDSLVTLHSYAERELETARRARIEQDWRTAQGAAQSAWAFSTRIYPNVMGTANDVVTGLVALLFFAIPFALICERLFVAGATIARKVAGFSAFFGLVFLFFFFFHPAFALATTPLVIFLAFVILLMTGWVISIIYGRFEREMEAIRRSGLGVHKADVSRLGTLAATVTLGISNMRRRPLRTALTGITVGLMTFILLTFASFNPSVGAQRIASDAAPAYNGIFVRQNGWGPMTEKTLDRVRDRWSGDFTISPLRWYQGKEGQPKFPITAGGAGVDGQAPISSVAGVIGCSADDPTGIGAALVRGAPDHGAGADSAPRGFGDRVGEWMFLPEEMLGRLGIQAGSTVTFRGRDFKAGLIDARVFSGLTQLGGEAFTPLALENLDKNQQDETKRLESLDASGAPMAETTSVIHLGTTAVAVLHESVLNELAANSTLTLRGLSLKARTDAVDVGEVARDMAQQLSITLRVGERGETYLITGVGRLSVAGLGAVLVPLILGGLIIFSTMLNSVAERGREIFIYASLGLAPIHVAALFLVEAGIYAVLGGLGGYMLAQLTVSALGFAASLGYGVQPDLNYSSFTAVATILLVMATVLLSALYPALVASRAANPGTSTEFRLPDPTDDRIRVAFPFTVAARDVRGLFAYLKDYFAANTEASTGCFTADDVVYTADGDGFRVGARVWLAPFDLGISQRFALVAIPTDVKAIHAVEITLDLLSGQRSNWKRANVAFMRDLRLQFLVWRTLNQETMDRYRALGGDEDARRRIAAGDDPGSVVRDPGSVVPAPPGAETGVDRPLEVDPSINRAAVVDPRFAKDAKTEDLEPQAPDPGPRTADSRPQIPGQGPVR